MFKSDLIHANDDELSRESSKPILNECMRKIALLKIFHRLFLNGIPGNCRVVPFTMSNTI